MKWQITDYTSWWPHHNSTIIGPQPKIRRRQLGKQILKWCPTSCEWEGPRVWHMAAIFSGSSVLLVMCGSALEQGCHIFKAWMKFVGACAFWGARGSDYFSSLPRDRSMGARIKCGGEVGFLFCLDSDSFTLSISTLCPPNFTNTPVRYQATAKVHLI